ncbi:hypothetical protein ACLB2K_048088 [Fragaria x ananassa]
MDDDVSHLPSFSLRPCTRLLPQIPNPNPPLHLRPLFQDPPAPFRPRCTAAPRPTPTQELRRVVENGDEEDHDFAADSWLRALEFGGGGSRTPLGSIKKGLDTLRVAKVVAMIKSCTPNGLGDLMLTLKDPTGTIGATGAESEL